MTEYRLLGPGPANRITDVEGLRVGNAEDADLRSGTTVLTADAPFLAAVSIMGGAPGTRETELLAPDKTVQAVEALVLSGGSAFGLAAADGVMASLRAEGRGFPVSGALVPIVPAAILFDLANGGAHDWMQNPYSALGAAAYAAAAEDFAIGSHGAGTGATTATLKGGLGSASIRTSTGHMVGTLVAVNALGSVVAGDGPHFWAAPFEQAAEFGGLGPATAFDPGAVPLKSLAPREATCIAIVATDAALTKSQATRLATAAQDGMARAVMPSHTPHDGDLIFAVSTGARPVEPQDLLLLGHAAATTLARAIARGVHAASPAPGDRKAAWQARFG